MSNDNLNREQLGKFLFQTKNRILALIMAVFFALMCFCGTGCVFFIVKESIIKPNDYFLFIILIFVPLFSAVQFFYLFLKIPTLRFYANGLEDIRRGKLRVVMYDQILSCEMDCSNGDDLKLIKDVLTIFPQEESGGGKITFRFLTSNGILKGRKICAHINAYKSCRKFTELEVKEETVQNNEECVQKMSPLNEEHVSTVGGIFHGFGGAALVMVLILLVMMYLERFLPNSKFLRIVLLVFLVQVIRVGVAWFRKK
jgi:hypothetical protein